MSAETAVSLSDELAGPERIATLLELADILGGLRYVELQLFRWLGEKAPRAETPELAVWASAASLAAAWRAELLAGLLPVSAGLPGAEVTTRSPGSASDVACTRLEADPVEADLVTWLAGDLYPALGAAYEKRRALLSRAADGPAALILARVLSDVAYQITAAQAVLIRPGGDA